MAKFRYAVDEQKIEKRLKEGRGSGLGKDYIPWTYVHDIPSRGKSSIRLGWTTGREHHLLSLLETAYFYILDWDDYVVDFREQYPLLPREKTQAIAYDLGIKHPQDPKTKVDIVMTTDFVATVKTSTGRKIVARSIKYENDLYNPRTKEKLLIEKVYWAKQNVDWKIVTEKTINPAMVRNIRNIHKFRDGFGLFCGIDEAKLNTIESILMRCLTKELNKPLADLTSQLDQHYQVPIGTTLCMVKHLIANKKLVVNMDVEIHPCNIVKFSLPNREAVG